MFASAAELLPGMCKKYYSEDLERVQGEPRNFFVPFGIHGRKEWTCRGKDHIIDRSRTIDGMETAKEPVHGEVLEEV